MIDRLRRANIPLENLCYEVDEIEWNTFLDYLQKSSRYQDADLSYIVRCTYMGMSIRLRHAPAEHDAAKGER